MVASKKSRSVARRSRSHSSIRHSSTTSTSRRSRRGRVAGKRSSVSKQHGGSSMKVNGKRKSAIEARKRIASIIRNEPGYIRKFNARKRRGVRKNRSRMSASRTSRKASKGRKTSYV